MLFQSYKDFAKEIIRILNSVGIKQEFKIENVVNIIKNQIEKHREQLMVPAYVPSRKFQIVPKCNKCNHKMTVNHIEGALKYVCECGNSIDAEIV